MGRWRRCARGCFIGDRLAVVAAASSRPITRSPGPIDRGAPDPNSSGDQSQDYIADGFTEELIKRLSNVNGLTVTTWSAVRPFKQSKTPLPEVARTLGVDGIVTGSMRRSGDRLQVMARLVDAAEDNRLWSERYERPFTDLLSVQSEVASAIGRSLGEGRAPAERPRSSTGLTTNTAAYDFSPRAVPCCPGEHQGQSGGDRLARARGRK